MQKEQQANSKIIATQFFRLLPIQVLIAAVSAVNNLVSSLFAGNLVGAEAMSAIGLSTPVTMFLSAIGVALVGGSQILSGKYMGKNLVMRTQEIFSVTLLIGVFVSALVMVFLVTASVFDLTKFITEEENVRALLNTYLLGLAAGILPMLLGQVLSAFLSLENRTRLATGASVTLAVANLLFNLLFVYVLRMDVLGLALATACGMWMYFFVQLSYYFSGRSLMKLAFPYWSAKDARAILGTGLPGALSQGYQAVRKVLVNMIILAWVGSVGLSAFSAVDTVMSMVWTIPFGMVAVSRMLFSVAVGEEDRHSLIDVMRTAIFRGLPMMTGISLLIVVLAVPLTRLYFRDTSSDLYRMTVDGFRLLPLCVAGGTFYTIFCCYAQTFERHALVHVMSFLDGVFDVAFFSFLLVPLLGLNGVFVANFINGCVTVIGFVIYAFLKHKRMPKNMEELMVVPEGFGVQESERMDLTLYTAQDVTAVAERVQAFCKERGIDAKHSYYAALCLEEMAGNVVAHGFHADKKKHSVDVRVVYKEEDLILRLKDDCKPFDPGERQQLTDPEDPMKNIGIRMVYSIASEVTYQNILGLNVLTMRI